MNDEAKTDKSPRETVQKQPARRAEVSIGIERVLDAARLRGYLTDERVPTD